MLVGSVVGNEIQNESEPSPMRLGDQSVEIREVPEDPRHIAIICDVISKIRHGRRINRRNPDSVDAKGYNMIQAPNNPREIADSIPIAILK
jgi:hypothetical protein